MLRERALGVVAASLAVALLGCPPQDDGTGRRTGDDDVLTGGEVMGIARAINAGEIEAARAVQGRLADSAAGGLAEMIIADHQRSLQELERVSVTLNLVPEQSDVSRELQEDVRSAIDSWSDAEGTDLNEDFISKQIDMHEKALEIIDEKLQPASTEPVMTEYLGELRATVFNHLQLARQLKDSEHRATGDPAERQEKWREEQEHRRETREEMREDRQGGGTQSETGEPSGQLRGRDADRGGRDTGGPTGPR